MAEPIHRYLDDDYSGPHGFSDDPRYALRADFVEKTAGEPAARSRWQCPYCQRLFERRKACAAHMGMKADWDASCPVLRAEDAARKQVR
jgi:uncharacterized C2H2 Zn-finger protein